MEEVEQLPDLSDIMYSIQALVLTVAYLHLASGRRNTGGQRRLGRALRIQVQVVGHAGEFSPRQRLPPNQQAVSWGKVAAPQVTMGSVGMSGQPGRSLGAFLELFFLLEDRGSSSPRSCLKRLETLLLVDRPFLLVCLENPDPHMHYVTPSFTRATP